MKDGERIEFAGSEDGHGKVVYLDNYRRKQILTHVQETYLSRYEGVGTLVTNSTDGYIVVSTPEHGEVKVPVTPEQIVDEFDGNLGADLQIDLLLELDSGDHLRSVAEVMDVGLIDAQVGVELVRRRTRIAELRNLSQGWHDGAGDPPTPKALDFADRLLSRRPYISESARIYPTDEGGVLFEIQIGGWDYSVECLADGQVEMYGVELEGDGEMPPEHFSALDDAFIATFDSRTSVGN